MNRREARGEAASDRISRIDSASEISARIICNLENTDLHFNTLLAFKPAALSAGVIPRPCRGAAVRFAEHRVSARGAPVRSRCGSFAFEEHRNMTNVRRRLES